MSPLAVQPFLELPLSLLQERLPELLELQALIAKGRDFLRTEILCYVKQAGYQFPVYALELGADSPDVPTMAFVGGIHGMERIGSQVVLAFLHSLLERIQWDPLVQEQLRHLRLIFIPLVNPGGMWQQTRSNPNGVDLMRNAPLDAEGKVPFLVGGQRFSKLLPWYRGHSGAMEPESQALCRLVREKLFRSPFSLALDCHSGFGMQDRVWFPYAKTVRPLEHLAEVFALQALFRQAHPHYSFYVIEPQSLSYMTHGDLWDFLYEASLREARGTFLPLTLEMGSWLWVKKNPWQLFQMLGLFNPIEPHRKTRILRRHQTLMEFLMSATRGFQAWLPDAGQRLSLAQAALAHWYHRPRSR